MKKINFFVLGLFLGLVMSCKANTIYEDLSIELENENSKSSIVKLTFINSSSKDLSLPVYIFCIGNSLYLDIFEFKNVRGTDIEKTDRVYFGGLQDFVSDQMIKTGEKQTIAANSKFSCEVDLSVDYAVYQTGEFHVTYVLRDNLFDSASKALLKSNAISVILNPPPQRTKDVSLD